MELTVHVGGTVAAAERFGAAVVESSAPASESGAPASEPRPRRSAPPGSDWPADAVGAAVGAVSPTRMASSFTVSGTFAVQTSAPQLVAIGPAREYGTSLLSTRVPVPLQLLPDGRHLFPGPLFMKPEACSTVCGPVLLSLSPCRQESGSILQD